LWRVYIPEQTFVNCLCYEMDTLYLKCYQEVEVTCRSTFLFKMSYIHVDTSACVWNYDSESYVEIRTHIEISQAEMSALCPAENSNSSEGNLYQLKWGVGEHDPPPPPKFSN
jgi:hypothetical protein